MQRALDIFKLILLHLLPAIAFIYLASMSFPWQRIGGFPASIWEIAVAVVPVILVFLTHLRIHPLIVAAIPMVAWGGLIALSSYVAPLASGLAVAMISAWAFIVAAGWRRGSPSDQ